MVGKTTHYNKNDDKSEQTEISIDADKKKNSLPTNFFVVPLYDITTYTYIYYVNNLKNAGKCDQV